MRMPRETAEAPELVKLVPGQQAKSDENGIERWSIVTLRRKENVARVSALVEVAHLVEEQPGHDLERAEARSDVSRPRALDHVERVDARHRRKRSGFRNGIDVGVHHPRKLRRGYVTKLYALALVRL